MRSSVLYLVICILILDVLAGCATRAPIDVPKMIAKGDADTAVQQLQEKAREEPKSASDRAELFRQRELFVLGMLNAGDVARDRGDFGAAEASYRRVLLVEGENARAQAGLEAIGAVRRHQATLEGAEALLQKGDVATAEEKLRPVLLEAPRNRDARALQRRIMEQQVKDQIHPALKASFRKPITLEFRDANLKTIFELISRTSGINFIFDKDVRPDIKATLYVKDSSIEDAIKVLLVTNQLEQKILNDNTVLIYPDVPAKVRDYQDLVVKSFYLANADVKQTINMIKTVVKTKDIFIDEKLNMMIMRDTPEAVAMAEKLIAAQDLAEPEVMLEMEVLEISASRLAEMGIRYPDKIGLGVVGTSATSTGTPTGAGGVLSLTQALHLNSDNVRVTVADPAIMLNLGKTDTDTNLLANPRIRVRNREKAKIHIGERVPVITTTSTANVGVSESVTYLEVGLKLDIEPNIYLEDEVAMKVGLEVSNIIDTVTTATGTKTYRLGTRTADTTLRLRDGETQILAGLIQDLDRKAAQKIPLLGDLPIVGRLFSSHGTDKSKTEIVLLITPHIVRNLSRPEAAVTEFMSGTEGAIGAAPLGMGSPAPNASTVTPPPILIPSAPAGGVPAISP